MAEMKKYLDQIALGALVDQIKAKDADVLAAAKKYTDDAGKLYDVAGAAATAEKNAKEYTDALANGQVAANKAAIEKLNGAATVEGSVAKAIADAKAIIDGDVDAVEAIANKNKEDIAAINHAESGILAQAKGYADGEVAKVQGEVDALETYVGEIPEGVTATSIVGYIQEKTSGIASEGAMTELSGRVGVVEGKVATIEGDYLKAADKTALEGQISGVQGAAEAAVDAEKSRAEGEEAKLAARIKTVEDDYLKAADKEELQGNINAVSGEVATIKGDYLKAADKTELEGKIGAKADQTALDAEIERATQAEAGLQTQINTIMNNPDTEGVINSINEFTQYIADHGEIAEGFRADINANAKAVEDHIALATQTYETKEDATAKYDEVKAEIAAIPQSDWNQGNPDAADYIKNRTHYEDVSNEYLANNIPLSNFTSGQQGTVNYQMSIALEANKIYNLSFNGSVYTEECTGDRMSWFVPHPADSSKNINIGIIDQWGFQIIGLNNISYDWANSGLTISVYSEVLTVKQLDEKFIPDTIARASEVKEFKDAIDASMDELEAWSKGCMDELAAWCQSNESVNTQQNTRIAALEGAIGESGSVAEDIATAKAEAIAAAAADAASKDAVVLSEAQKYVDGEIDGVEARVAALETASATHALAADLNALSGRVGTAEGEIDTLQSEMDAVEALAAANKAAHEANAAAIALKASSADLEAAVARIAKNEGDISGLKTDVAAKAAQADLEAAVERIAKNETDIAANTSAINSFTAITSDEVNALFA